MTFQNKKILVAGLGGTGISMIAYLRKNGAEVAAYDAELKPERVSQIGKMFDGLYSCQWACREAQLSRETRRCRDVNAHSSPF